MATTYKTPGVYVEEVTKLPPSVAQVETAIPAFIGYTKAARKTADGDLYLKPTRISSLLEYERYYGTMDGETIAVTVEDELLKEGTTQTLTRRVIQASVANPVKNNMWYQMQMYFANGGGPCYIVAVAEAKGTVAAADLKKGLEELKKYDEPTLIVFPEGCNIAKGEDLYSLYNDALMQSFDLKDRFAIMDVSNNTSGNKAPVDFFREKVTGGVDPKALHYGAAYYPMLQTSLTYNYADSGVTLTHKETVKEKGKADVVGNGAFNAKKLDDSSLQGTELYSLIKAEIGNHRVVLSPSAAMAGAYATVDASRGVWKAPANVSLNYVSVPTVIINDRDQEGLNVDPTSGKSINAIRSFTGQGIKVWGARTLAGNDNEWRYVPVRRFFNMVEESVKKATNPFVFEPNDANTWVRVKAMIENFLILQWRAGALQGAKPEHAFYVAVGLNQTMSALDILEGRMIVEIGMAVVRPAEFIILRFSHKMAES
ncbi:MAG TPA: phage tail sheath C-terminal domain-containing protein [Phnomibacter sp.]|nr:phage tail sheath C-terminal domain-containing protein [Phnomibacter sp.]